MENAMIEPSKGASETNEARVARVSHIQINCTDLRKSVAFYELLGFEVDRIITDDPDVPTDFGDLSTVPLRRGEWGASYTVGLGLGDDPRAMTKLELIQWESPRKTPLAHSPEESLGVVRVAFTVRGVDAIVERLKSHGHAPGVIQRFDISRTLSSVFAHVSDPDGSWLTLTEWIKTK